MIPRSIDFSCSCTPMRYRVTLMVTMTLMFLGDAYLRWWCTLSDEYHNEIPTFLLIRSLTQHCVTVFYCFGILYWHRFSSNANWYVVLLYYFVIIQWNSSNRVPAPWLTIKKIWASVNTVGGAVGGVKSTCTGSGSGSAKMAHMVKCD